MALAKCNNGFELKEKKGEVNLNNLVTKIPTLKNLRLCLQLFHDLSPLLPRQHYVSTDVKPVESQSAQHTVSVGRSIWRRVQSICPACGSFRRAPSSHPDICESIYCVLPVQRIRSTVTAETEVVPREKEETAFSPPPCFAFHVLI